MHLPLRSSNPRHTTGSVKSSEKWIEREEEGGERIIMPESIFLLIKGDKLYQISLYWSRKITMTVLTGLATGELSESLARAVLVVWLEWVERERELSKEAEALSRPHWRSFAVKGEQMQESIPGVVCVCVYVLMTDAGVHHSSCVCVLAQDRRSCTEVLCWQK